MEYEYIFLDLDGPVLEGKHRHYQCYLKLVSKYGGTPIEEEKYWDMKRCKIKRVELLKLTRFQGSYDEYLEGWMSMIETREMLSFDKKKPNIEMTLVKLKKMCTNLVLLTMRNNDDSLDWQLNRLCLKEYFNQIIVCSSFGETPKYSAVKNIRFSSALVIGDTEEDERTAKLLNAEFWAVTNGIRKKECLNAARYASELYQLV